MESVSSALPLLFEDNLAGEKDDNDKGLLTILENKDDDDEDGILPLNQSRLLRAQEENSPSPVQVDMDLLEIVDRLAGRGSDRDPHDPPVRQFILIVLACVEVLG